MIVKKKREALYKIKRKPNPKLTLMQEIAVSDFVVNGGKKAPALRKAGYSDAIVKNPARIFDSPAVKEEISAVLAGIKKMRDNHIKWGIKFSEDEKTMIKLGPFYSSLILKDAVHNSELLSGRPTSREVSLTPAQEKELEELLKSNKK